MSARIPSVDDGIMDALPEIIGEADLEGWLQSPNDGFGGAAPRALIDAGNHAPLWEVVRQTRHMAFA